MGKVVELGGHVRVTLRLNDRPRFPEMMDFARWKAQGLTDDEISGKGAQMIADCIDADILAGCMQDLND